MSYSGDYYDGFMPENAEFYEENEEVCEIVEKLQETMRHLIKYDFIAEMSKLKKENERLQKIKKDFGKIKEDYEKKEQELERKERELERKVRHARLSELMKDSEVELFTVATSYKTKPKCNKCDENRLIHYTTPTGRQTYDTCLCGNKMCIYEPIKILLNTFSIDNGRGVSWYKVQGDAENEHLRYYEDSMSNENALITKEDQFKDVGYAYKTLFKTKELAQKFCDYKNKGVSSDD